MRTTGAIDLAYVRIGAAEPDATARFLSEVIGLQPVAGKGGDRAFRSDDRYHTVAVETIAGSTTLGVEMADLEDLERAEALLRERGFEAREADAVECERRFVSRALVTKDASGNNIDLVLRPARSGRRYFGTRDAGILGLQSVGLRTTDLARDVEFWRGVLGARVSDRVGDIAYLRLDSLHHRVALYPSARNGLLYATFAVESLDQIMQNFYHLQERQVRVVHGPGREKASGQSFVRFTDPSGQMFAFGCDMAQVDETKHRPRQFSFETHSLCAWGSECRDFPELQTSQAL